jgi:hypothetical protein
MERSFVLPLAIVAYLLVYIVQPLFRLFLGTEQEFIFRQVMDGPQHIVRPCQGILGHIHIDLLVIIHEQFGPFIKVCLFRGMVANIRKGLFDRFPKVFNPCHQIQQLRYRQVGQFVSFGASNLIENLLGAHMCDTRAPQGFQSPIWRETGCHLALNKTNFRSQSIGGSQNGAEDSVGRIIVIGGALSLKIVNN